MLLWVILVVVFLFGIFIFFFCWLGWFLVFVMIVLCRSVVDGKGVGVMVVG